MFQKSKLLLIPLILAAVAAATLAYTLADVQETWIGKGTLSAAKYYEITVDSCQYIVVDKMLTVDGVGIGIVHKGNCPNHK